MFLLPPVLVQAGFTNLVAASADRRFWISRRPWSRSSLDTVWDGIEGRRLFELLGGEQAESEGLWSGGGDDLRLLSSNDALVRLRLGPAGEMAAETLDTGSIVESVVWSPDGSRAALSSIGQPVAFWEWVGPATNVVALPTHSTPRVVECSPTGDRWVLCGENARAWLIDASDGAQPPWFPGRAAAWFPDGRHFVTGGDDGTLFVRSAGRGEVVRGPLELPGVIDAVAVSPDGRWIVAAATNQTVRVWEGATGKPWDQAWSVLSGTNKTWGFSTIMSLRFSPDSSAFAVASSHSSAVAWRIEERRRLFEVHTGEPVTRVAWSPDRRWFALGTMGREVWILDARSGARRGESLPHIQVVTGLEFSADSKRLLVATGDPDTGDGRILVWGVPDARRMLEVRASERGLVGAAFTRQDREIVSISFDGALRRHDVDLGLPTADPLVLADTRLRRLSQGASGSRLLVSAWSAKAWRVEVRLPSTAMPDWVLELAECLAGERILADGTVRRVTAAEFVALRRWLGAMDARDPRVAWGERFALRDPEDEPLRR